MSQPACKPNLVSEDCVLSCFSLPRRDAIAVGRKPLYLGAVLASLLANGSLVLILALDHAAAPKLADQIAPALSVELIDVRRSGPPASGLAGTLNEVNAIRTPKRKPPLVDLHPRSLTLPSPDQPSVSSSESFSPDWTVRTGREAPWRARELAACHRRNPSGALPPHCAHGERKPALDAPVITGTGDQRRDQAFEAQRVMDERWRRYREEGGDYPGLRNLPSQF